MVQLRRRNMLVGLATIVFGASGFIASGAFSLGSEGSLGSEWVQVAGADQAVAAADDLGETLETDGDDGDGGDGGDGDGDDGGDGGDGADGDDGTDGENTNTDGEDQDDEQDEESEDTPDEDTPDEETPESTPESTPEETATPAPPPTATPEPPETATPEEDDDGGGGTESPASTPTSTPTPTPAPDETTRVQVVTDPDDDGNYVNQGQLTWDGQMAGSETVTGDDDGLFEAFTVANANKNAVSRVGLVDERGYPSGRIAFLVANVGDPDTPGQGGVPVDMGMTLRADNGDEFDTAQLNFPYRTINEDGQIIGGKRGTDLLDDTVTVPTGQVIEVVIEVDSTEGTDEVERVSELVFGVTVSD